MSRSSRRRAARIAAVGVKEQLNVVAPRRDVRDLPSRDSPRATVPETAARAHSIMRGRRHCPKRIVASREPCAPEKWSTKSLAGKVGGKGLEPLTLSV